MRGLDVLIAWSGSTLAPIPQDLRALVGERPCVLLVSYDNTSHVLKYQLQHQSTDHHDSDINWMRLGDSVVDGALRELEQLLSDSISGEDADTDTLEPPSGLVVWMCSHCLDLPSQTAPRELHDVKAHVRDQYVSVFLLWIHH